MDLSQVESQATAAKATLCHIPPQNPANATTIDVAQTAVDAHLAHGDYRGACQSCRPGSTRSCYSGSAGTEGVGACHAGAEMCGSSTGWGSCSNEVTPVAERCGDAIDNDCDGLADEGCICVPGTTARCYDGPADSAGVGTCAAGTKTCNGDGSAYGTCVGDVMPAQELCIDGLDNNCDGNVDEGCVCAPSSSMACYDGPPGTAGVGVCHNGAQTCNGAGTSYGSCIDSMTPSAEVCGDGLDNNCDGVVDDGCVCAPHSVASCYQGPAGTAGVGTCEAGTKQCNETGTAWSACGGAVTPAADVCGDGLDTNCNGTADELCVCAPGSAAICYSGAPETLDVGTCVTGTKQCAADGYSYEACVGEVGPTTEVCGDHSDNDCDGVVDDGCVCAPLSSTGCYGGPPNTAGIGACRAGIEACNSVGTAYGACTGDIVPVAEVCGDGIDNDCDGTVDDGCVCAPNSTSTCYGGPAGTETSGVCHLGLRTCNPTGTAWGDCTGDVVPVSESCGDALDNDCDGITDDGCVCLPSSDAQCETGGFGECRIGTMACNGTGTEWGSCTGPGPVPEACGDGLDTDCDGMIDNGCVCPANTRESCDSGMLGACAAGTRTCRADGRAWDTCVADVRPAEEVCGDATDNDCDGVVDNGCVCIPNSQASCDSSSLGVCKPGTMTCDAFGTAWGDCVNNVQPVAEVCSDSIDNDCNGVINNNCVCVANTTTLSCYSGPPGTQGVGSCRVGSRTCNTTGTAFGACFGEVDPVAEVCYDGLDNNCNGTVDEGCLRTTYDPSTRGANIVLSPDNLTVTGLAPSWAGGVVATKSRSSGMWYWEVTAAKDAGSSLTRCPVVVGLRSANQAVSFGWYGYAGQITGQPPGMSMSGVSCSSLSATIDSGDVVGVAWDATSGIVKFKKNNTDVGSCSVAPGLYFPLANHANDANNHCSGTANFGATPFRFAPPFGYSTL